MRGFIGRIMLSVLNPSLHSVSILGNEGFEVDVAIINYVHLGREVAFVPTRLVGMYKCVMSMGS